MSLLDVLRGRGRNLNFDEMKAEDYTAVVAEDCEGNVHITLSPKERDRRQTIPMSMVEDYRYEEAKRRSDEDKRAAYASIDN